MLSALLKGRDHNVLGATELIAEAACAVALSRGGAAKTYSHTEPNEDACLFAEGDGGALIAVADGHHGAIGAEIAMAHLLEHAALRWTSRAAIDSQAWLREASKETTAINLAIQREAERCGLPPSPTTLCFAIVRPNENQLIHGSVGDSHLYWTREGAPIDLGWGASNKERPAYLGYPASAELEAKRTFGVEALAGTRSLVLVTDGFSEDGIGHASPATELHSIQGVSLSAPEELRAIETCRGVVESAAAIQRKNRAGDNIACAVYVA
jgi:hypothetical protein